jgi:hypothetical protein
MGEGLEMDRQQKTGCNWFLACGVGCFIALLALIAVGIALVYLVRHGMRSGADFMAGELRTEYAKLKDQGKIPEEHAALFDELVEISSRDDASLWTVILCSSVVTEAFSDGNVDAQETAGAQAIADFVREDPSMGIMAFAQFYQEHPELEGIFERYFQQCGIQPEIEPPETPDNSQPPAPNETWERSTVASPEAVAL